MSVVHRLATHVSALLTERGMNQKQLAERIGFKQGSLSQILSGKRRTGLDTLDKIAAALGVDVSVLCGSDITDTPKKGVKSRTNTDVNSDTAVLGSAKTQSPQAGPHVPIVGHRALLSASDLQTVVGYALIDAGTRILGGDLGGELPAQRGGTPPAEGHHRPMGNALTGPPKRRARNR